MAGIKKKPVLLTSCGLYPQTITETIYALNQLAEPVKLEEVHVITTELGFEQIKKYLLDPEEGHFYKLQQEYDLQGTDFELDNIQLLENAKGIALDDIVSEQDNEAVADSITELVRDLTLDDGTALYVSLTGGRRTVSYYLGYALSLFGREQDHLLHAIVSRGFEGDDEFYYPNKKPTYITDRSGKKLNTQDAKVHLAEIPFVRMRNGLPKALMDGKVTFLQAVSSVAKIQSEAEVRFDLKTKKIWMNDTEITFSNILYAWYYWLAKKRKTFQDEGGAVSVRGAQPTEFSAILEELYGIGNGHVDRTRETLEKHGFSGGYMTEKASRINDVIHKTLGTHYAMFLVCAEGKKNNMRYSLQVDPEHIIIDS